MLPAIPSKMYEETKPSIVISHDAPIEAAHEILSALAGLYFAAKAETVGSRTCAMLQKMFEAHRPDRWYCGHYHVNPRIRVARDDFPIPGGTVLL